MVKSIISGLKQAAKKACKELSSEEKIQSLSKAFELFKQQASHLETSYTALQEQFRTVYLQLEETNRKLQNKLFELDMTTHYLDSILANMSQGLLFISLDGMVTTYNIAAQAMLEEEARTVLFSSFWDVFKDDVFGFSMKEALATNKVPETTFITIVAKNNKLKNIEVLTTFAINKDEFRPPTIPNLDYTQGLIVLIRDITEVRKLQLIASRNDRMKELGEMAAMVAHEIRNPLGGIKGFASLLQRDLKNFPELQQMATYIMEGTDNLNRLVTNVLNYSRPLQIHFEPTNFNFLVQELRDHIRMDSSLGENIKIELILPSPPLITLADTHLIKSAILNLVVNSIQAMLNGGTLTIELAQDGESLIIKVIDTGIGISPENIEKIFTPFFTTKASGNGFGLAEVYKVVQGHDGTIDVKSEPGNGSTFTIKIPFKTKKA